MSWKISLGDLPGGLEGGLEAGHSHPEGDSYYLEAVPWWSGDEMGSVSCDGACGEERGLVRAVESEMANTEAGGGHDLGAQAVLRAAVNGSEECLCAVPVVDGWMHGG